MIRKFQIVFALSMGVIAGVMLAQTEADFSGWMKGVAAANKGVKGAITAKDAPTVAAAAKTLEDSFKQVETFFSKKGTADAAAWAKANHEAASAMGKAATAGNWDAAGASAATIAGSCNTCHAAHRDGAKGGPYTIK